MHAEHDDVFFCFSVGSSIYYFHLVINIEYSFSAFRREMKKKVQLKRWNYSEKVFPFEGNIRVSSYFCFLFFRFLLFSASIVYCALFCTGIWVGKTDAEKSGRFHLFVLISCAFATNSHTSSQMEKMSFSLMVGAPSNNIPLLQMIWWRRCW